MKYFVDVDRQADFDQQAAIALYHLTKFRLLHAELRAFLMEPVK